MVLVVGSACSSPGPNVRAPNSIEHRIGAFGLTASDARTARAYGVTSAVANFVPTSTSGYAAAGVAVIDAWPQRQMYKLSCPSGQANCQRPTARDTSAFMTKLREHVREASASGLVHEYYILDDDWFDFSSLLPSMARSIKSIAPEARTLCAFALPISTTKAGSSAYAITAFRDELRNYSPSWCDDVGIYSYLPKGTPSANVGDWSMQTTLSQALELLRSRGWHASSSVLVGMPQTFGISHESQSTDDTLVPGWPTPSERQLATQISAFCAAGARAIVAYTWRLPGNPRVPTLANTPALRRGLLSGASRCVSEWHRESAR